MSKFIYMQSVIRTTSGTTRTILSILSTKSNSRRNKAQILQHGRLVIIFHTCNTHLNHGFNHASCVKQPVCLHGIRCGTSCGQSSGASCGQCRLYCAYGPWHSIRIHAYEVQGIHKQHKSSFGCGSWLCRSGGKECESCCAFYQTNLFP